MFASAEKLNEKWDLEFNLKKFYIMKIEYLHIVQLVWLIICNRQFYWQFNKRKGLDKNWEIKKIYFESILCKEDDEMQISNCI